MALRHGYTVVPFSAIGVEDALDIVVDADELFASPLGPVLRKLKIPPYRCSALPTATPIRQWMRRCS